MQREDQSGGGLGPRLNLCTITVVLLITTCVDLFICTCLMYTVQECRKQAEELGSHHLSQLLQVEFTDAEIKFVPDTSDVHAEIKAKAAPVVSISNSSITV